MKRFFAMLLVVFLLVSMCACGRGYTEEEQKIINGLYTLRDDSIAIQQRYDESDEEIQELLLDVTEALYNADKQKYEVAMELLKLTNVVIPDDLPEILPDFKK